MAQKRSKKYNPNKHAAKAFLPEKVVQDSLSVLRTTLMRLRLSQKKPQDLVVLAVYWAIGLHLSGRMEEADQLRATFSALLEMFREEVYRPGSMSGEVYDACLDALPLYEAFLRQTTIGDMNTAQAFIAKNGGVPEMRAFLDCIEKPEGAD